jgi:hypothetical protein
LHRVLAAAALAGLLLAAPHAALAFDYAEPVVPTNLGGPADTVIVVGSAGEFVIDAAGPPQVSLQSAPNAAPFVPHGTWDDAEGGGCAVWNWNIC